MQTGGVEQSVQLILFLVVLIAVLTLYNAINSLWSSFRRMPVIVKLFTFGLGCCIALVILWKYDPMLAEALGLSQDQIEEILRDWWMQLDGFARANPHIGPILLGVFVLLILTDR